MLRLSSPRIGQKHAFVCLQCSAKQIASRIAWRSFHLSRTARQARQGILGLLEERGYVNQIAGDRNVLNRILNSRRVGIYAGIDPTAPSLHLGHLLPLMVLFWLYNHGHHVVSLVGGSTSKVGDPSGRLTSRVKTAESVLDANLQAMQEQMEKLWTNAIQYTKKHQRKVDQVGKLELLNNAQWLDSLNILHFLKVMGNGMRLGALLGRDTVKNKMEKGDGMSFSEFTYPLLQAWDWWQMYQERGIQIQIGGGDQYGNIIAGIDAVKYIAQSQADADGKIGEDLLPMGLTVPLLTTSSGEKFGKSAGNAVWLDRTMTSPFDLYGFLLRSADDDVERYLKLFTFVPMADIASIMKEHAADPGKRRAHHLLASEVLELVHGPEEASKTRAEHQAMRTPTLSSFIRPGSEGPEKQISAGHEPAGERIKLPNSLIFETPFARILYHAGLVPSRSEGTRLVNKGGAYVALASPSSSLDQHVDGEMKFVPIQRQQPSDVASHIIDGRLILRIGKWKVRVIEVVEDSEFDANGLDAPGWVEWKAASVR